MLFVTRYHTFYLVNNQESYNDLRYCLNKEENFTLGDIMRSSHNVHLRYQNMKYSGYGSSMQGCKMFLKRRGCGGDICKNV